MATPASVQATSASDFWSTFDIDKPERYAELVMKYNDQGLSYFDMLKTLGFVKPAAQDTVTHDEEDFRHETFHSRNIESAGANGAATTLTLDAIDLDGSDRFYIQLNDEVMFSNEVVAVVTDVDVTTPADPVITVKPLRADEAIPALAAGEEIIIIANIWEEGSAQPESKVTGTIQISNFLQIIKETFTVTGTEMTNQKWFNKLSDGRGIDRFYIKGQMDQDYRFKLRVNGAILFGKNNTNSVNGAGGRLLRSTRGMVPFIRENGNIIPHTPGSWSVAKFNEIGKRFDKNWVQSPVLAMMGYALRVENEDVLVEYLRDTAIDYTANAMYGGNKELAATVKFGYLCKGSYEYFLDTNKILSHQKLYGAAGYDLPNMGIFLPTAQKKAKIGADTKNMPIFGCRYKALGPYNRMTEIWDVSGAGPGQKVIATDEMNFYQRGHIGAQQMAGNQMVLVDPQ